MKSIGDRIQELLDKEGIKKVEFAKKLGITQASVSTMCSGKTKPSGSTIKVICSEYGINEEWLVNGNGEMYADSTVYEEIGEFVSRLSDQPPNAFKLQLMRVLSQLPEEHWETLADVAKRLYESMNDDK